LKSHCGRSTSLRGRFGLLVPASAAMLIVLASCGSGGGRTTVTKTSARPHSSAVAPVLPACITGVRDVEFFLYGSRSKKTCALIRYRLVHAYAASAPSLDIGDYVSEFNFAHDNDGDYVVAAEVGADNGDVNTLIAGVMATQGYQVSLTSGANFKTPG
jgi:hypothetical protein